MEGIVDEGILILFWMTSKVYSSTVFPHWFGSLKHLTSHHQSCLVLAVSSIWLHYHFPYKLPWTTYKLSLQASSPPWPDCLTKFPSVVLFRPPRHSCFRKASFVMNHIDNVYLVFFTQCYLETTGIRLIWDLRCTC